MKSNVDLTLDKIFSNPPRAKILLNEIAAPKGKYPWSFSKRYSHYGPVLTGNASDRKEARLCELEIQMICGEEVPYCYRCGKRIIPWQRKGNLCTECDAKIMPDIHLGFEVPEDWIFNTDDRVVLELNYKEGGFGNVQRKK